MLGHGDFGIGSTVCPGIGKVIEECNELGTECAKLIGTSGSYEYWGGHDLKSAIQNEMGDVLATIRYASEQNGLDLAAIMERAEMKYHRYMGWHVKHDPLPGEESSK